MTHPDPQSASPETDLRVDSDVKEHILGLAKKYAIAVKVEARTGYRDFKEADDREYAYWELEKAIDALLARPDALREKVMAAIDYWWGAGVVRSIDAFDIDALKAVVAAVLEGAS